VNKVQQVNQSQLNDHLTKELSDLKQALKGYQLELEAEKRKYTEKVREL